MVPGKQSCFSSKSTRVCQYGSRLRNSQIAHGEWRCFAGAIHMMGDGWWENGNGHLRVLCSWMPYPGHETRYQGILCAGTWYFNYTPEYARDRTITPSSQIPWYTIYTVRVFRNFSISRPVNFVFGFSCFQAYTVYIISCRYSSSIYQEFAQQGRRNCRQLVCVG